MFLPICLWTKSCHKVYVFKLASPFAALLVFISNIKYMFCSDIQKCKMNAYMYAIYCIWQCACMFMYSPSCGPPYLFFHLLPAEDLCLFIVNFDSNLRECKKMVNKILWCYWIPILNWLTSDFQFVNLLILKPFNVDLGLGFEIDWYEYQKKTSP